MHGCFHVGRSNLAVRRALKRAYDQKEEKGKKRGASPCGEKWVQLDIDTDMEYGSSKIF